MKWKECVTCYNVTCSREDSHAPSCGVNSFFNLLYYSYEMRVQIFRRLPSTDPKLKSSLGEIGWTTATGMSFCSFFLILFLNCSTIATKCMYKYSEGCARRIRSYIKSGWNRLNNSYRYEFLLVFSNSFFIINCSTIATKCTYKFLEGCTPRLRSYIKCCRSWLNNSYRYEFLLVFSNSFFKLLYYSYEMHL